MSQRQKVIGFIGLGNMGRPMAANLLKANYPLSVYDLRENRCRQLGELGARVCRSNKEVAELSEVIITVLPTSKEVREVVLGMNGVLDGLRGGQVLVEMSSIESEAIVEVAREVEARKCWVIDAAISGVEEHAERREIVILAGGSIEVVESCSEVLRALSKAVVYTGGHGTAKVMKTATAMLGALSIMGATEVLTWVAKRGLDPKLLLEIVKQVPSHARESARAIESVIRGRFKPRPSWSPKDVGFGLKSAEEFRIPTPLTAMTQQMFVVAKSLGLDGYEVTGIACKVYEALANVKLSQNG